MSDRLSDTLFGRGNRKIPWYDYYSIYNTNCLSGNATLYNSVVINFPGNERNGIEAVEKYSGLVHNIFRRAIDRDDLHFSDFTRWENPSTIGSSLNTYLTFRLHLFDCYFLVSN